MNATSLEKSKRGNLYVYRFATGSQTPEYPPPVTSVTKKIIPSSVWGGLIKSKSKSKSKTKTNSNGEEKEGKEKERERKSVSSVESILMMSLESRNGNGNHKGVVMKGRKSVEVEEGKGKGKGMGMGMELIGKKEEGGRKSVSHVENNVAYVGRFVEDKARKSNGAKLENDVISVIELLQVKVLVTDMPAFMQIHAFQCARKTYDSLEKFSAKHMAYNLKKEFDKVYGPAWHCIVGSSFGSFVTHATGCFLYFSMEKLCILLFRTKVKRVVQ